MTREKRFGHGKAMGVCVLLCTLWQVSYPAALAIAHSQFMRMGEILKATGGQPPYNEGKTMESLRESWISINWKAAQLRRPALDIVFWVLIAAVLVGLLLLYGRKWTAATVGLSLAVSLPAAWGVARVLSTVQDFPISSEVWIMGIGTFVGGVSALALALFVHWLVLLVWKRSRGKGAA